MTWIANADSHDAVLGLLPDLAGKFEALYASLWQQPHLPAQTLELCRLRLAQLHRSDADWQQSAVALPGELREQLVRWDGSPAFAESERACLAFTEVYAMDTQAITDDLADAVKSHHGDHGLIALVEALVIFDGLTRLHLMWDIKAEGAG